MTRGRKSKNPSSPPPPPPPHSPLPLSLHIPPSPSVRGDSLQQTKHGIQRRQTETGKVFQSDWWRSDWRGGGRMEGDFLIIANMKMRQSWSLSLSLPLPLLFFSLSLSLSLWLYVCFIVSSSTTLEEGELWDYENLCVCSEEREREDGEHCDKH